jgi:hypothetical protein
MSRLFIPHFAKLGAEHVELYWLAGITRNVKEAWFVRAVVRGMTSGRFHMRLLPIGMLPLLTLGKIFAGGELLSLSARGIVGAATIADMSQHEEITSTDIPHGLYSFDGKKGGIQRLFRYRTPQTEILIPTIELVRYLFLHNRTLANALMRPGALNLLFHPEVPGYRPELTLHFTADVPKRCLSHQFAQEFAWIALDPDARRSWDSVCHQSQGQAYVTFMPPPLKNSVWKFRGVRHGNRWLVLELLHLTGKCHPCDKLFYGHPSLKHIVRKAGESQICTDSGSDDHEKEMPQEYVVYDYQLDDGHDGSKSDRSQKEADIYSKQSGFDRDITINKLLIDVEKPSRPQPKASASGGSRIEKHQTIKVSAGEQSSSGNLPPLDFKMLTPADWNCLGDLEAFSNTVRVMADRLPEAQFAMSLCQIKAGRVFSMANRKPRAALVVTINLPDTPPIVLLDVERTGDVALSLMALRFKRHLLFEEIESSVKLMLDSLVDASGHWGHEAELELAGVCSCERFPKMLTPRENAGTRGQTTLWAVKLLRRLGLIDREHQGQGSSARRHFIANN